MALSTAQDLIDSSLRLLGVIDQEGTPTTNQRNQGLDALNALVDSFVLDRLMVYASADEAITLTTASTTWGSSYTINTVRPIKVTDARRVSGGYEYPIDVISMIEYRALQDKTVTGTIRAIAYDATYPSGTLYAVGGVGAIKVTSLKPWTQYAALSTSLALPPGYVRAMRHALALELHPEYPSARLPQVSAAIVSQMKSDLASVNAVVYPIVNMGAITGGLTYDANTDSYL